MKTRRVIGEHGLQCVAAIFVAALGCTAEPVLGGGTQPTPTAGTNATGFTSGTGGGAGVVAGAGTGDLGASGAGASGTGDIEGGGGTAGEPIAGATGGAGESAGGAGEPAGGAGVAGQPSADVSADECVAALMAAGTTVTGCETCLCQPGNCQAELAALDGDVAGNAMIDCIRVNPCEGTCCLCGAVCDSALGTNFGAGPCGAAVQTAAGVTPGIGTLAAIENAPTVMQNCAPTGPADNSCARATRLAACVSDKCADVCPRAPACM
jgi:hypothetical protein